MGPPPAEFWLFLNLFPARSAEKNFQNFSHQNLTTKKWAAQNPLPPGGSNLKRKFHGRDGEQKSHEEIVGG